MRSRWPAPRPASPALTLAVLGLAGWVGGTFLARPGLQWTVAAAAALLLVCWAARFRPERARGTEPGWRVAFGLLAVSLFGVIAIRDSGSMTAVTILAGLAVAAFGVAADPRLLGLVLAPWWSLVAWGRSFTWWPAVPRGRRGRLAKNAPLLRGAALGIALVSVVGGLLASADGAFGGLLGGLVPTWDPALSLLRAVIAVVVVSLVAALMFGAASPPPLLEQRASRRLSRLEWLLPLLALVALLGAFFAVQAAVLFDAYPDDLVHGQLTPAERARQGFGQLVAVSLIVTATLGWAASRSLPADRRWVLLAGGALLLQLELLVVSALRRMYLYESTFGWTVLRVEVAVFEVWLGVLGVVLAGLWVVGLGRHAVRVGVFSAGLGVLLLALAGPDLIVARGSVDRLEATGRIDAGYLARLSSDATPALVGLPEPYRSCALAGQQQDADPWYATNLARWQEARVLETLDLHPQPPPEVCSR